MCHAQLDVELSCGWFFCEVMFMTCIQMSGIINNCTGNVARWGERWQGHKDVYKHYKYYRVIKARIGLISVIAAWDELAREFQGIHEVGRSARLLHFYIEFHTCSLVPGLKQLVCTDFYAFVCVRNVCIFILNFMCWKFMVFTVARIFVQSENKSRNGWNAWSLKCFSLLRTQ